MEQVITISRDGQTVSGLQHKKGKGLDLIKLGGKAKVERVSLIEWDETRQAWYVNVLQAAGRGTLTLRKWIEAVGTDKPANSYTHAFQIGSTSYYALGDDRVLWFDDYDDGVAAEIEYLNALRKRGEH